MYAGFLTINEWDGRETIGERRVGGGAGEGA